jgi:hypothetical protein
MENRVPIVPQFGRGYVYSVVGVGRRNNKTSPSGNPAPTKFPHISLHLLL